MVCRFGLPDVKSDSKSDSPSRLTQVVASELQCQWQLFASELELQLEKFCLGGLGVTGNLKMINFNFKLKLNLKLL